MLTLTYFGPITAKIYLLKISNRKTRKRCEIFSKLTIKTPEQRYLTLFPSFSIVDFEQVMLSLFIYPGNIINYWFSDVFQGYKKGSVVSNGSKFFFVCWEIVEVKILLCYERLVMTYFNIYSYRIFIYSMCSVS